VKGIRKFGCVHRENLEKRNSNIYWKSDLSYTLFTSVQLVLYGVVIFLCQKPIITNTHSTAEKSNRTRQFERSYNFDYSRASG
jgi:hypothetical protein